jgi:hypothetical protein
MEVIRMKYVAFLIIVLVGILQPKEGFSLTKEEKSFWWEASVLIRPEADRFEDEDIIELIENTVPSDYVDAFIYYSQLDNREETAIFRLYLLGLGQHESGWIKLRSNKKNKNGTFDHGYLMLNEANIYNNQFMRVYGPVKEFEAQDWIEKYLITCIRFFKYLYLKYGCDALYAYNAGETSYSSGNIPKSTYIYKYRIKCYVDGFTDSLYEIAERNRVWRHEQLIAELKRDIAELKAEMASHYNGARLRHLIELFLLQMEYPNLREENWILVQNENLYDPRKRYALEIASKVYFIMSSAINDKSVLNAL